jgi:photosystem II stability/assembly factor-like uncharacterized protein
MRIFCLSFLLLATSSVTHSQFYVSDLFKNSVSGNKQASEKVDLRNNWFFKQRLYPYTGTETLENAHLQRSLLRNSGYTDNSSSWVSIGPSPGQYNFGATSSRVRVVAFDPDETNIIYIGASNGGVWKSIDGGTTWAPKTDFEISNSSGALAVYNDWSTNPPQRIVYYGTGEGGFGFVYSYYGSGLLKSTDGGDSWRRITNGLPQTTYFYKIAINPASPNVLLAALGSNYSNPVNNGGLYRSSDFGESWTRIVPASAGENGMNCTDVIFSPDGSKAYILGPFITGSPNWWENGTGYRISSDGGNTFTPVSTNLPAGGYLAVHPSNPDLMYALMATDCSSSSLYRSVDAGNSWAWINSSFSSNQCGYNLTLELDPANHNILYVGTVITYKSTDRGNNFSAFAVNTHFDIHDIAFNPKNPEEFILANDGGVYKIFSSTAQQVNLNQTISTLECYSISSNSLDPSHILTGTQDNGVQEKTPSVPQWKNLSGFDATNVIIDRNNPNTYLVQLSSNPVGIHVSTNAGLIWSEAGGFSRAYDYAWVRHIAKHPSIAGTYYTPAGARIWISNNFGFSWSEIINNDITDKIESFAISASNPLVMYASTGPFEYMPNATQHKLYKSVNGGTSWTDITSIIPNRYISAIAVDEENENDVIAALAGFGTSHLYHSVDGGQSWTTMDCNGDDPCLPDVPFNDFIIYRNPLNNMKEYYAATDLGVFASYGENLWHELYGGLPNTIAMDIEIVQNKLRVATFGRGLFEWDMSGSMENKVSPRHSANANILMTNYPNPFNPATDINIQLPSKVRIKLAVYDVLGRQIEILADGMLERGDYKFKWNGEKYSSGIYFYRLESAGISLTKKMLLVK